MLCGLVYCFVQLLFPCTDFLQINPLTHRLL